AMVRVLGTRFLVRNYHDETASRVVVEDGRVALHAVQHRQMRAAQAIVGAGMLGQVSDSGVIVVEGIDPDQYTAWTRGTLVFDRSPLRDVVKDLARAYGVDIRIADSLLANRRITVELDVAEKPLTRMLTIL